MKQGDPRAALKAREVADFLTSRGLRVFAERAVVEGAAACAQGGPLPSFSDLLPFDPRGPASTSEEEEEDGTEEGHGGGDDDEARQRRRVEQDGAALAAGTTGASEASPPLWSPRGTGSGAGSGAGRGAPLPPRGGTRSLSSSGPSLSTAVAGEDDDDGGEVDFCVTLGGDGTVLSLASLFDVDGAPLPPVLSLAMGTLGFLTPFDARQAVPALAALLNANEAAVYCTLRTRKICSVLDARGRPVGPPRHVLNECLIDRGSSPAIIALEVAVDGEKRGERERVFFQTFFPRKTENKSRTLFPFFLPLALSSPLKKKSPVPHETIQTQTGAPVTTVAADGVIVATPSGSTAYSLSAGGPLVAPSVPATLLTPVAPHSLSFRPLVLPELAELRLTLPLDARCGGARVTFDGRHAVRLPPGGCVVIATARAALPCITHAALDLDWWEGLVSKLAWNAPIRHPGGGREGGEEDEEGGGSFFGGGA